MTNIYFWGKIISPSFQKECCKGSCPVQSFHCDQIVEKVECGAQNAFILTEKNQLYAFGSNEDGQMGIQSQPYRYVEISRVFVPTKSKIAEISCGWYHTVILDQSGNVFSSGKGYQGAIGQGSRQNSYSFKQVMSGVKKISAGYDHSLAIKGNKTFGWGNTQDGQLGLHSKKRFLVPQQLNVYPCEDIFAGVKYSIFVTVKGVYGCGLNNNYQLGLGNQKNFNYPKNLNISDQIVETWGANYCFAKNKSGQVYIWGSGSFGVYKYPTKIPFFQNCDHISLGATFGVVSKNNRIFSWGSNRFGELGIQRSNQIKDYAYECSKLSRLELERFSCGGNFVVGLSYGEPFQIDDKLNSQHTRDQVKEDDFSQDFSYHKKIGYNGNIIYSSFQYSPSIGSQKNQIKDMKSCKLNKNMMQGYDSEIGQSKKSKHQNILKDSENQNTMSNHTVKKLKSIQGRKSQNQNINKVLNGNEKEQISQRVKIEYLAQQIQKIKSRIKQKNKYAHCRTQQDSQISNDELQNLKFTIRQQQFQIQKLKQQQRAITNLIGNEDRIQRHQTDSKTDLRSIFQENDSEGNTFEKKLGKLRKIMQQAKQNCEASECNSLRESY